jgi:hypothetical protein
VSTVKQVHRQHTLGLGAEELPPAQGRPDRCRVDTGALQDGPDGAGPNLVAEPAQLTVDAAVAPGRVLPGQPQHQSPELQRHAWTTTPVRVAPAAPNPDRGASAATFRAGRLSRRSNVSGRTIKPCQLGRGNRRASPASTARSAQFTRGRVTPRRSTATSWRSISSSAFLAAELRASNASHRSAWQNSKYSSRSVMRRSSWPHGLFDQLAAQHPRSTFWHPQVSIRMQVKAVRSLETEVQVSKLRHRQALGLIPSRIAATRAVPQWKRQCLRWSA